MSSSNAGVGLLLGVLLLSLVFSCWLPWWAFFVGILLIGLGIYAATRGAKAGGGALLCGVLLLGLSIVTLRVSGCMATRREEKDIQLANAEVAEHMKLAQDYFGKGQTDSAEAELTKAAGISKATDTQAVDALRAQIQKQRQDSDAFKANLDVREKVTRAGWAFDTGALEDAEKRLQDALAVPRATETAKARELLAKVQTALAEKHRKLANEQVAKLVATASESLASGELDKAEKLVNEAHLVQNATETQKAVELFTTIKSAQAQALLRAAEQAIEQRQFSTALQDLNKYVAHSHSTEKEKGAKLLQLVQIVATEANAQAVLKSMSEQNLKSFSTGGQLADDLTADNAVLMEAVKAALRKHVASELDRRNAEGLAAIARQKQADEARARQAAADEYRRREKQIEEQFSVWDGSHRALVKYIKQRMNDADSFEHVETKYGDFKDYIVVSMQYRGKNAFGAKVLNAVKAKVSVDGTKLEILETLP